MRAELEAQLERPAEGTSTLPGCQITICSANALQLSALSRDLRVGCADGAVRNLDVEVGELPALERCQRTEDTPRGVELERERVRRAEPELSVSREDEGQGVLRHPDVPNADGEVVGNPPQHAERCAHRRGLDRLAGLDGRCPPDPDARATGR